jgi:hypothetical protein
MLRFERPDIKAAASPALLQRGCVNVIGLEALRDKAGVRWPKIRDGVYARLEALLRQRLGPADFFVPLDEVSYLVTMPATEANDTKVACLRVAYDLYTEYLGVPDLGYINIYRVAQSGDDTIVLDRIVTEELKSLSERAGTQEASQKPQGPAEAVWNSGAKDRQLMDFRTHFLPVWDAKNEAITLYTCLPQRLAFQHAPVIPVTLQDLSPKDRTKVEIACIRLGVEILARRLERGERFLIGFRIAFETLSSHISRVEFTSACRELPSDFRQYIVFTLTDVPAGVPHSRLGELVMTMKPYARAVMSEVPTFHRDFLNCQGIGLQAIGLNLEGQRLSAKDTDDEMLRLASAAKRLSLSTFVGGVTQLATLRRAHQLGVQFLTGSAIAAYLPDPGPMTRLHWDEVIKRQQDERSVAR